jgi:hypothetical protein
LGTDLTAFDEVNEMIGLERRYADDERATRSRW